MPLIPNEPFCIYVRRGLWALLKTRSDFKAIVGNAGSSASYRLTTNSINPPSASASGVFRNRGSVARPFGPNQILRNKENHFVRELNCVRAQLPKPRCHTATPFLPGNLVPGAPARGTGLPIHPRIESLRAQPASYALLAIMRKLNR